MNENIQAVNEPAIPSTPAAKLEAAKKADKAKANKTKAPAKAKANKTKKPAPKAKKAKDGEKTAKGPEALRQYAPGYVHDSEHKTAAGNPSVHCGDEVAKKLLGKSLDECYKIAAKVVEESEADLRKKYGHLNLGMQRMNLGNKMRGVINAK